MVFFFFFGSFFNKWFSLCFWLFYFLFLHTRGNIFFHVCMRTCFCWEEGKGGGGGISDIAPHSSKYHAKIFHTDFFKKYNLVVVVVPPPLSPPAKKNESGAAS